MLPALSDLADCTVTAWVMEGSTWRFVFDSSDGEWVVQHEILGISEWRTSELNKCVVVMEIEVQPALDGKITYKVVTACNEVIEITCTQVRETTIKPRRR